MKLANVQRLLKGLRLNSIVGTSGVGESVPTVFGIKTARSRRPVTAVRPDWVSTLLLVEIWRAERID